MFKPMLAATAETETDIRFPCIGTPKLDGIRVLNVGGKAVTRSLKPLRNAKAAALIQTLPPGVDGELIAGSFQDTASTAMSADGGDDFEIFLFDWAGAAAEYTARLNALTQLQLPLRVRVIPLFQLLEDADALLRYEELCLSKGFEGVVTRDPRATYKWGRSTLKEQGMVKLKRWADSEAVVIGFVEQLANLNPIQRDELGRAARPGTSSLHLPKGTLGSLAVRDCATGVEFHVGSGFDDALRQRIWDNQNEYMGRTVTYRYQRVGVKDKPRFPTFLRFRSDE